MTALYTIPVRAGRCTDEPLTEEQIRSAIRSPEEPWEVDLFWMWHNGEIAGAGYLPDTDQRVGVPEFHDELGFDPDAELYWWYTDAVDRVIVGNSRGYLHDHVDKQYIATTHCPARNMIEGPPELVAGTGADPAPFRFEPGTVLLYRSTSLWSDEWYTPRPMTFVISPGQALEYGLNKSFEDKIVEKARVGKQHWYD